MTYECAICLNLNHAAKLHCSTCGAVPALYSFNGRVLRGVFEPGESATVESVIAHGADRAEHHKTSRVYFRTVPTDYYAS